MIYVSFVCVFVLGIVVGMNLAMYGLRIMANNNLSDIEQAKFYNLLIKARGR